MGEYASMLTDAEVDVIYNAGREAAAEYYRAEQEKADAREKATAEKKSETETGADKKENTTDGKKGGVFYGYDGKTIDQRNDGRHKPPTQDQQVAIDFTKRMAKRFGTTVYFYESYVDENGKRMYKAQDGSIKAAKKGFYDPKDGSIHIDLNGDHVLFTVSHELVHFIKDWSPKQFKKMADLVMEGFNRQGLNIDALIANKQAEYAEDGIKLTEDQAFEEVVAAALEGIMADGRVMELMQKLEAEDKSLGAKVKKFFQNIGLMIRKAIDTYKGSLPDSAEGRLIRQLEDIYSQLQEAYAEGVYAAGTNFRETENTTNEGGVRYANKRNYDFSKSFAEQVDDFKKGLFPKRDTLLVGGTPKLYQDIGFNALPMTIDRTHVDYAINGTKNAEHFIGEVMLKQIPTALEKPIAVIVSQTKPTTSVVVLLSLTHNGEQVIAPIYLDGTGKQNGISIDSNVITSVHGRGNAIKCLLKNALIQEASQNIGVFYWDKKAATALLTTAGVTMPQGLSLSDGHIHSIRENGSPVNMKFQSVTESQQFKKWFGNWKKHPDKASKIVNADGTPKIMYHGTMAENGDFYIFDENKAVKKGGLGFKALGKGNYFTVAKLDGTERYGSRIIAAYLDIKTPFVFQGGVSFREQVSDDLGIDAESMSYDEIQTAMRNKGYDGVIEYDKNGDIQLAVTFDSNQIKSVDNIGTFDGGNPDIRYSIGSKTDGAVQALLEKENDALREDVSRLKDLLKLQGTETHGTKFTASSVESAARYLKKNAGAKGDTKALAELLKGFYEYIATADLTWEGIREQAKPIANWLMDHREHTRSEYAQEVLDQIRGNRVSLDETQMAEAAYRFESYDAFRRSMAGAITISKNANMSLDSWWHEMAGLYPDVFDETLTASDMPGELFDIVNRLRNENSSALEYEHNRRWIEQDLIRDVYDSYWRVNNLRTVADRYAKQMNRLKSQHAQRISDLKIENREKIEELKAQHKAEVDVYRNAYRQKLQEQHMTETMKLGTFYCPVVKEKGHIRKVQKNA